MSRWRDEPVLRLTVSLLAGSATLVVAGTAGVGGSIPLVLVLAGLTVALRVGGEATAGTEVDRVDPHHFLADAWRGVALVTVLVLYSLDASPGELQAIGGLVGLFAMANYFLRPVYHLVYALVLRVRRAAGA